jgi:hypothetical protein
VARKRTLTAKSHECKICSPVIGNGDSRQIAEKFARAAINKQKQLWGDAINIKRITIHQLHCIFSSYSECD